MSITIESPNKKLEVGSIGFCQVRNKFAALCPAEISKHYDMIVGRPERLFMFYANRDAVREYNTETERLYQKYEKEYGEVFDFLYASDSGAEMTPSCTRRLFEMANDSHCSGDEQMNSFKELLKDAVEHGKGISWNDGKEN